MRKITRDVKFYCYEFGTIDASKGTVAVDHTVTRTDKWSTTGQAMYAKEHGVVLLRQYEQFEKFAITLEQFVQACRQYAAENANTNNDSDEE